MFYLNIKKTRTVFYTAFLFVFGVQNEHAAMAPQQFDQFREARHAFHRTYFEKAFILFSEVIRVDPERALSYAYAAMTDYMLFKDPGSFIDKAKSKLDNEDPDYFFTLALLHFVQSDLGSCESIIKQHLTLYPDDAYAQHVLGFTQIDANRPQDGLFTLKKLISSHPDYYPAYNHIGYAYLKLNQPAKALDAFEFFVKKDSINPSAYDSFADGLTQNGLFDQAIAQLAKAVLIEPGFAYGWKHMGDILQKANSHELARKAYQLALDSSKFYGDNFRKSIIKIMRNGKHD